MQVQIEARNLTKDFEELRAVDDLSFDVKAGEIFGLLGPNGAGKTTTLRMLSGLLTPSSGEAFINGHSMSNQKIEARKSLGFLTGEMDLYRRLKPLELLKYFGNLYEVPEKELDERINHLADVFGINDFKDRYCEKLSTGQKQRVSIVRTLVHDPQVVILDEPTTGLDIMASEFILQFIRKMAKEEGKTVIFSTHHLNEVERLCDRIAIIHEGKLKHYGTMQEAKSITQRENLADAFFNLVTEA
ncbi:MAG: ABC transporter ATP-binding protein [Bacteroidetes bacterium]|nr:MAG: ABC transporter ATP-binding protein [Bacteroidota bacterium]